MDKSIDNTYNELYQCFHFSPNSSSSSSSPPKNLPLKCRHVDSTLPEDSLRNRSSFKKNRSYYKSKRKRRQGSQSSIDRSPVTKRSPMSPSAPKEFPNGDVLSHENGDLSYDDELVAYNGATSPPKLIPGIRTSVHNSSDSGPHPASSCESDVENQNDPITACTWDVNPLRSYNNNTNISKRTRTHQNEQSLTDSSGENSGEISELEDISCIDKHDPFELLEDEDEHLRQMLENRGELAFENFDVSIR